MTSRSRSRLTAAVLAVSAAAPLAAAGPASADLVPLPPLPTVDTTCLNAADPVQCEIALLQGTATGTVTTVTSQPPLAIGGTGGGTGTSTTSLGSVPTATGGTVQQGSAGHRAVATKKRHYRLHRSRHHRRR